MAFKKMATGKKTVADFYADLKFKACIRHICAFEGPGDENKYKDPHKGIMVYFPFGLDAVANLTMEDINVLRTTTNAGHWRVLPIVLNEYYIRYYCASNINLFEDVDLARTAFDVLINIGNFEAFTEGVNKIIPGCFPDNKTVLSKNSCERLNLEIKIKKNQILESIAICRIQRHGRLFKYWKEAIAEAMAAGKENVNKLAQEKAKGDVIGNSLLERSLIMIDGDFNSFPQYRNLRNRFVTWQLIPPSQEDINNANKTKKQIIAEQKAAKQKAAKQKAAKQTVKKK